MKCSSFHTRGELDRLSAELLDATKLHGNDSSVRDLYFPVEVRHEEVNRTETEVGREWTRVEGRQMGYNELTQRQEMLGPVFVPDAVGTGEVVTYVKRVAQAYFEMGTPLDVLKNRT